MVEQRNPFTNGHELSFPPWKRGIVRFFDPARGYGFVQLVAAEGGPPQRDVFLSQSRVFKRAGVPLALHSGAPCAVIVGDRTGGRGPYARKFALLNY